MTTVRELVTKLSIAGDAAEKLGAFGLAVNGIKSGLEILSGAFSLAKKVLFDFTAEISHQGDKLAKTANAMGVSVIALQEMAFAADMSGASMADVETAVHRMERGLNDAITSGTGPFADSLDQIGMGVENLDGLDPIEKFQKLAGALAEVDDAGERAALAQEFFGKGARTLLPLINEGEAGIQALRDEFQKLGGGFTEDGAAAAEEFDDAMTRLNVTIDSIKIAVGTELFPVIQSVIDGIRAWAVENRELIRQKLLEFIQSAIAKFQELLPKIVDVFHAFVEFLPTLEEWIKLAFEGIEAIGGLENALKFGAAAFVGLQLASMSALGPVGLIAGAFVALLPIAMEVGDAIGDIAFETTQVARAQAELDRQAGGRSKLRGTAANIQAFDERRIGQGIAAQQVSQMSEGEFAQLERSITSKEGKRFVAEQKRLRKDMAATNEAIALADREREKEQRKAESENRRQAAMENRKRAGGKGKGKGKAAKKEEAISDAELLKIIETAARERVPLDDLIGTRDVGSGVAPVITVTVTNVNVDQDVHAPVTVSGVASQIAEDVARMVEAKQREVLESEFRRAIEDFLPAEAR